MMLEENAVVREECKERKAQGEFEQKRRVEDTVQVDLVDSFLIVCT